MSAVGYAQRLELGGMCMPKLVASDGNRIILTGFLIRIYSESYEEDGHELNCGHPW